MEKVTVYWKPRAFSQLKRQAQWYAETMGIAAADKFWNGMIASGELLRANPYLGKIAPILHGSSKIYRSLVQHKNYKIIYSIEDHKNIQIVAIWHCSNLSSSMF